MVAVTLPIGTPSRPADAPPRTLAVEEHDGLLLIMAQRTLTEPGEPIGLIFTREGVGLFNAIVGEGKKFSREVGRSGIA